MSNISKSQSKVLLFKYGVTISPNIEEIFGRNGVGERMLFAKFLATDERPIPDAIATAGERTKSNLTIRPIQIILKNVWKS